MALAAKLSASKSEAPCEARVFTIGRGGKKISALFFNNSDQSVSPSHSGAKDFG